MKGLIAKFAGAVATSTALAATPAIADDCDILRRECVKQLKMSSSGCDCIAASAKSDLNDQERGLVVAHVSRDTNGIMNIQKSMPSDSVMKVMTFLAATPQKCAGR